MIFSDMGQNERIYLDISTIYLRLNKDKWTTLGVKPIHPK